MKRVRGGALLFSEASSLQVHFSACCKRWLRRWYCPLVRSLTHAAARPTGDHVAVFAENSDAVVAAAAAALGLPLDFCFRLSLPSPNKHSLPEPAVAGPLTLRCVRGGNPDLR